MPEAIGRPLYQEVADDIRAKIASGELKVGDPIPSTAALMTEYHVSNTAARNAVNLLREEGLVIGQPGKGVFVRATPAAAAGERASVESLHEEVTALRADVRTLTRQVEALTSTDDISAEVKDLRRLVEHLQAHLRTLYDRLGQPYPADSTNGGSNRRRKTGS